MRPQQAASPRAGEGHVPWTGYLLGQLGARAPQAEVLAGIDAAPAMIEVARAAAADDRLGFVAGTAEQLPWPAATFDLAVSTNSFDHWADQETGLFECARVLAPTAARS